jgi:putative glutamine amidotransferase
MPKPLILISTGRTMLPTRGDDAQATKVGCDSDYVSAIIRAGGSALLLPPHGDKEATRAAVSICDGIMFTGGGDIHSLCYGAQPHPKSYDQDPLRDATELLAFEFAAQRKLPILGVCRGAQLINVARGGTLLQDIPSDVKDAVKHDSEGLPGLLLHSIYIEKDSILGTIFDVGEMAVNSFHHQSIGKLGAGLKISATASDGVVEAIESDDQSPILGVTFHPEECAPLYPAFDEIFKWLVRAARLK